MAILTIQEYLNSKGKTIEKAETYPDCNIPEAPKTPQKAVTKGKSYNFPAALKGSPNPYISKEIRMGQEKDDEMGLGFLKSPGMDVSQKPETNAANQLKEHCGCEEKKAPHVVAYASGAYHPDPIQAIKYIVYLTNENENILKALMHEAKRVGCLDKYANIINKFKN